MVLLRSGFCCFKLKVACLFIAVADVIICTVAAILFDNCFFDEIVWSVIALVQLGTSILLVVALGFDSYRCCAPYLIGTFGRLCWTAVPLLVQLYNLQNYVILAMGLFIFAIDSYFWLHVYSMYLIFGGEALIWT
ncbi:hypothetical protein KR093_001021 [Drosophila rubida]|uniref:Uncharacterized protein n=1 Tax=Drosophila rubida TaxID=30044 RepID=A0AAD4PPJ8_9MUSC|nr:hypothetical protein KR093_001021 [Drosophila rubida]